MTQTVFLRYTCGCIAEVLRGSDAETGCPIHGSPPGLPKNPPNPIEIRFLDQAVAS